jgi:transcriptional regulator with XRE-family HTH domain
VSKGFTYKSYNFQDKDPIIDEVRTIVQASGWTHKRIQEESGVTTVTLHNWFAGSTRKPQAATLNAVARALGYKLGFVPYEAASAAETPPAASVGHAMRMAKIRRVK